MGDSTYIETIPTKGYRFTQEVNIIRKTQQPTGFKKKFVVSDVDTHPYPEAEDLLKKNKWPLHCIDGFIETHPPAGWCGWKSDQVSFKEAGKYEPNSEIKQLMEIHKPFGKSNLTYSLYSISQDDPFLDGSPSLHIKALRGDYKHVFAQSRGLDPDNPECKPLRDRFVNTWWPLESSPLYHNVNCEIIIISADQQVLLTKRSNAVKFSPGVWSASIEEQFIRYDPEEGTEDKDLFECVERGAGEELGTEIDTNRTRLLNIGLEWGDFTAAFLFIAWSTDSFDKIVSSWIRKAPDKYEALAIDCLPASTDAIRKALEMNEWIPSDRIACRLPGTTELGEKWHLTSRARLYACFRYLEYLESHQGA